MLYSNIPLLFVNNNSSSISSGLTYYGVYDAKNNIPKLTEIPEQNNIYYIVSTKGEQFGLELNPGDWLVSSNGKWEKISSKQVNSVNGQIGDVVLNGDNLYYDETTTLNQKIDSKQDKLIAGKNIIIENNVISTVDMQYGAETFIYTQAIPSKEWKIVHNLQKFPNVTVVDSAKTEIIGDVEYLNKNEIKLYFASPFSGEAYLN